MGFQEIIRLDDVVVIAPALMTSWLVLLVAVHVLRQRPADLLLVSGRQKLDHGGVAEIVGRCFLVNECPLSWLYHSLPFFQRPWHRLYFQTHVGASTQCLLSSPVWYNILASEEEISNWAIGMELANPMGHDLILSVKYFVNYKMTINVHQNKPEEYLVSQPLMHIGRESVVGHCAKRHFHKL